MENIWKDSLVTYSKYYLGISGETEEEHKEPLSG
jgi:hypothetical protein